MLDRSFPQRAKFWKILEKNRLWIQKNASSAGLTTEFPRPSAILLTGSGACGGKQQDVEGGSCSTRFHHSLTSGLEKLTQACLSIEPSMFSIDDSDSEESV